MQIRHVPSVSSRQSMHCSRMDFLGDAMYRLQLPSAHCCRPSASLWQHSSPILISFLSQMILIMAPSQHLDEGSPPCWDETTQRPGGRGRVMRLSCIGLSQLWWEWGGDWGLSWRMEASSHWFVKCLPVELSAQSPYQALQGKWLGAAKMNSTVIKWLI